METSVRPLRTARCEYARVAKEGGRPMPMLEVLIARDEPLPVETKRAFAREAVEIFREVLGTQPGRLRLVFYELKPEDTLAVLDESSGESATSEHRG